MSDIFETRNQKMIERMAADERLSQLSREWFNHASHYEYSYHFTWMGRPIIQWPQDIVAMQEILWRVRPDLVIETGVARGGSQIFYASMLELLGKGKVIGIDIDIRPHNRVEIERHPMFHRIELIEGSSIDPAVVERVAQQARQAETVLVVLDSNHTHQHVLEELRMYSPLVTRGSYLVVFDTVVEHMPPDAFPDRPWGVGDNPMTAVQAFLRENDRFEIDHAMSHKLQLSVCPSGYLRCVRA